MGWVVLEGREYMQLSEFRNEPLSDFKSNPEHIRSMGLALEEVGKELGHEYDLVIGGKPVRTDQKLRSLNPSHKDQVIGVFSKATPEMADQAIRTAEEAFNTWSSTPAEERATVLVDTARIFRERKYYFAAWMVYEVGKS